MPCPEHGETPLGGERDDEESQTSEWNFARDAEDIGLGFRV